METFSVRISQTREKKKKEHKGCTQEFMTMQSPYKPTVHLHWHLELIFIFGDNSKKKSPAGQLVMKNYQYDIWKPIYFSDSIW